MLELFRINDKDESKKLLRAYIYSRLLLIMVIIYVQTMYGKVIVFDNVVDVTRHFDGLHYFNIAKFGYTENYQYAFFPLLPLLVRISLYFFNSHIPIVILLNFITYLTGVGIYNLSKNYYSENAKISKLLSYIWFFSPMSIYTMVLYTEPLYCFITICILFLYKTRKKPLLMGILLGLLVSTRSTGSLLFFTLFICMIIDYFKDKNKELFKEVKYIMTIYIPATIISCLYPLFLQIKLGNWKYFIDVQYECWAKVKSNFITVLLREIEIITTREFASMNTNVKIHFISQTVVSYILLITMIILIYTAIKNRKIYQTKELLMFLMFNIFICYSMYKGVEAPSTSYYRYFLSCISLYLLVDNEKIAKVMLWIGLLLNIYISGCHCIHNIMF